MTPQTTLRGLARNYANGTLNKETYRKERTAYLDSVLSGKLSVQQLPHPPRSTTQTPGEMPERKAVSATEPTRPDSFNPRILLLAGAAVIALVVIIVLIIFSGEDEQATSTTGSATATVAPTPPAPASAITQSAAQGLIKAFLASNVWSETSLQAFLVEWNAIPDAEKAGINSTVEFSQLTGSIYKKLVEERALSTIGNPETSLEKQRQLVEFASRIGITDPRISLPQQTGLETP